MIVYSFPPFTHLPDVYWGLLMCYLVGRWCWVRDSRPRCATCSQPVSAFWLPVWQLMDKRGVWNGRSWVQVLIRPFIYLAASGTWNSVSSSSAGWELAGLFEWTSLCGSVYSTVACGTVLIKFTRWSLFWSLAFSSCILLNWIWGIFGLEFVSHRDDDYASILFYHFFPKVLSDTLSHLIIRLGRCCYFIDEDFVSDDIIQWNKWDWPLIPSPRACPLPSTDPWTGESSHQHRKTIWWEAIKSAVSKP